MLLLCNLENLSCHFHYNNLLGSVDGIDTCFSGNVGDKASVEAVDSNWSVGCERNDNLAAACSYTHCRCFGFISAPPAS